MEEPLYITVRWMAIEYSVQHCVIQCTLKVKTCQDNLE